jgi:hypothetical protein
VTVPAAIFSPASSTGALPAACACLSFAGAVFALWACCVAVCVGSERLPRSCWRAFVISFAQSVYALSSAGMSFSASCKTDIG